jgi:pimeloyl-ACP methyl ester carboxylesterase
VEKLIVLNAPHPAAYLREMGNPVQWLRSWYVLFFQLPRLPEWTMAARDFALLERVFRRQPVRPDAFTREDIRRYKEAMARPGAITAALNYYRAAVRYRREARRRARPVEAPTFLIWGEKDRYLGSGMTRHLSEWVPNLRVARLPGASHFVQNDAPEKVNELMLAFLREGG